MTTPSSQLRADRMLKGIGNGLTLQATADLLYEKLDTLKNSLKAYRKENGTVGVGAYGLVANAVRYGSLSRYDIAMPDRVFTLATISEVAYPTSDKVFRYNCIPRHLPRGVLLPKPGSTSIGAVHVSGSELHLAYGILAGWSDNDIVEQTSTSYPGLRSRVTRLIGKLGVCSRGQIALHFATGAIETNGSLPIPELQAPMADFQPPEEGCMVTIARQPYASIPSTSVPWLMIDRSPAKN